MPKIPTVAIKHEDGYCIINESDFNADEHELYEGDMPAPAAPESDEISTDEPETTPETGDPAPEVPLADLDPVEEARREAIDIPDDWDDLPLGPMRALARHVSGDETVKEKDAAMGVISAELDRRAG